MSEQTNPADPKPPSVDRLSQLWHRINEHKMVQWSAAYVALAYAIQHAVVLTREAFEWPQSVERISMLLLVLGLPLVMTFAWYHGARASRQFTKAELSILSALLVVGSLLFYAFVRPSGEVATGPTSATQQASVTAARAASSSVGTAISIAVLPFVNLSSDKEQEFFSDGMTEEITAALAKVPDLRVVARTSAFEFKGKSVGIEIIGQQLHATHLIEGSVRKAGNRLRITAQLIKADDGTHIWAEDYDRDLTDVFAIQEDIARAITASLRMPLGLKPGENLVNQRTKDTGAHEEYLRAKSLVRANLPQAIRLLNDIVARDPNYAPAWGALARAYELSIVTNAAVIRGDIDEATPFVRDYGGKAIIAAEKAYRLDPNNSDAVYGYAVAMELDVSRMNVSRMPLLERSLALDPDNPEPLQSYSFGLAGLGFTKQALKVRNHLIAVEPFVPTYRQGIVRLLFADGQLDEAIKSGTSSLTNGTRLPVAQAYAAQGRFREAADVLAQIKGLDVKSQQMVASAVQILRDAPAPLASNGRLEFGVLDWIYVYRGAPERLAEAYENLTRAGIPIGLMNGLQFAPAYAAMRKASAFKQYIRDSGALEYWRAKGWPDLCRPMGADDFVCD